MIMKRILSLVLALVLCISVLPVSVFAVTENGMYGMWVPGEVSMTDNGNGTITASTTFTPFTEDAGTLAFSKVNFTMTDHTLGETCTKEVEGNGQTPYSQCDFTVIPGHSYSCRVWLQFGEVVKESTSSQVTAGASSNQVTGVSLQQQVVRAGNSIGFEPVLQGYFTMKYDLMNADGTSVVKHLGDNSDMNLTSARVENAGTYRIRVSMPSDFSQPMSSAMSESFRAVDGTWLTGGIEFSSYNNKFDTSSYITITAQTADTGIWGDNMGTVTYQVLYEGEEFTSGEGYEFYMDSWTKPFAAGTYTVTFTADLDGYVTTATRDLVISEPAPISIDSVSNYWDYNTNGNQMLVNTSISGTAEVESVDVRIYKGTDATGTPMELTVTPEATKWPEAAFLVPEAGDYYYVVTVKGVDVDTPVTEEGSFHVDNIIEFASAGFPTPVAGIGETVTATAVLSRDLGYISATATLIEITSRNEISSVNTARSGQTLTFTFEEVPEGEYCIQVAVTYEGSNYPTKYKTAEYENTLVVTDMDTIIDITGVTAAVTQREANEISFDAAITPGDAELEYVTFQITDPDGDPVTAAQTKATDPCVTFIARTVGDYTCTVTAKAAEATEAVTKTFTVSVGPNIDFVSVGFDSAAADAGAAVSASAELGNSLGYVSATAKLIEIDSGAEVPSATDNKDGQKLRFTFDNVPAGEYRLQIIVTRTDGNTTTFNTAANENTLVVTSALSIDSISNGWSGNGVNEMAVVADITSKYELDSVEIRVYQGTDNTGKQVAHTTGTDTSLSFTVDQMGNYFCQVTAVAEGISASETYSFTVGPWIDFADGGFVTSSALTTDTITAEATLRGDLGYVSATAKLIEIDSGAEVPSATANKNGQKLSFTFHNVPAGEYRLRVIVTKTDGYTTELTTSALENTLVVRALGSIISIDKVTCGWSGNGVNEMAVSAEITGSVESVDFKVYQGEDATGTPITLSSASGTSACFTVPAEGKYFCVVEAKTPGIDTPAVAEYGFTVRPYIDFASIGFTTNTAYTSDTITAEATLLYDIGYRSAEAKLVHISDANQQVAAAKVEKNGQKLTCTFEKVPAGEYRLEITVTQTDEGTATHTTSAQEDTLTVASSLSINSITNGWSGNGVNEMAVVADITSVKELESVEIHVYQGSDSTGTEVTYTAAPGKTDSFVSFTVDQMGDYFCQVTATAGGVSETKTHSFTVGPWIDFASGGFVTTTALPTDTITAEATLRGDLGYVSSAAKLIEIKTGAEIDSATANKNDQELSFTFHNVPVGEYRLRVIVTKTDGYTTELTTSALENTLVVADSLRLESIRPVTAAVSNALPNDQELAFACQTTGTGEIKQIAYQVSSQADPSQILYSGTSTDLELAFTPGSGKTGSYLVKATMTAGDGYESTAECTITLAENVAAKTVALTQVPLTLNQKNAELTAAGEIQGDAARIQSVTYRLVNRATANGNGTQVGSAITLDASSYESASFTFDVEQMGYYTVEMEVTSVFGSKSTVSATPIAVAPELENDGQNGTQLVVGGGSDMAGASVDGMDTLLEQEVGDGNVPEDASVTIITSVAPVSAAGAAGSGLSTAAGALAQEAQDGRPVVKGDDPEAEPAEPPRVEYFEIEVVKVVQTDTDTTREQLTELGTDLIIWLPFDATGRTNIRVYSYHGADVVSHSYIIEGGKIGIASSTFSLFSVVSDQAQTITYLDDDNTTPLGTGSYGVGSGLGKLLYPSKEGYDFVGWYDKDGNRVKIISAAEHDPVTLVAKWVKTPVRSHSWHTTVDGNPATGDTLPIALGMLLASTLALTVVMILGRKKYLI